MDTKNLSLADALFNRTQQAIFWLLLLDPEKSYHLRGVVNTTGLATGTIQRELRRLTEIGLLCRQELRHQVIFSANTNHPVFPELRNLVVKVLDEDDTNKPLRKGRTAHYTARGVNLRTRFIVMRRDGFRCTQCGRTPATDPRVVLEVDHVKAWADGGETIEENLRTLCRECNRGKGHL